MCLRQRCLPFMFLGPRRSAMLSLDVPQSAQRTSSSHAITRLSHLMLAALGLFCLVVSAFADAPRETQTLRVAVYDVPPYGYVDSDGSISGVSVDLWRRVAEQMEWPFRLIPISDMESIISGLEQGRFDAASRSRRKGLRGLTSPIRLIGLGSRSPCEKKRARSLHSCPMRRPSLSSLLDPVNAN